MATRNYPTSLDGLTNDIHEILAEDINNLQSHVGTLSAGFPSGKTFQPSSAVTALTVDQDYNAKGIFVDNAGTQYGIHISQVGVLATDRHALYIHSNAVQVNTSKLLYVYHQNTNSTQGAAQIDNNSTGDGLEINQGGVLAASNYGLKVHSTVNQQNSPLVFLHQDHASSNQEVLSITQDAVAIGFIDFVGSDRGVITGATNSTGSVRVELNGVVVRLATYVDA